jgi:hypothetical protein
VVSSLRSAGWADASVHPRHATWRESDITHLLLQDLMTSPSSDDGSFGESTRGSSPGENGDCDCPPFPAKCQGPITAQTVPVGAGTAPDGPSAAAESNLRKSSPGTIVVAPALRCYSSAIDLGSVEEMVIV